MKKAEKLLSIVRSWITGTTKINGETVALDIAKLKEDAVRLVADVDGPNTRRFALLSPQGTACPETVLTEVEYSQLSMRMQVQDQFCNGGDDDPVRGSWTDVTENEACQ